jgi:DNA-directed RNA polymerase subunit RPC12/RpoP
MHMRYNSDKRPEKEAVTCPYCGSRDTECMSLFGQQLMTAQYYCNACHTPFERVKDDDVCFDYVARKDQQP